MPLQNIAAAVQRASRQARLAPNPLPQVPVPAPRFIDASGYEPRPKDPSAEQRGQQRASNSTSISSIKQEFEAKKSFHIGSHAMANWENCRALKRSHEKLFCLKFGCYCAKEKCPSKYIES